MDWYLGQIIWTGFNFAPTGWGVCNGATMPIDQNTALFSLIEAFFGGDGQHTFALPNLGGAAAIGTSAAHPIGQTLALGGAPVAAAGLAVPASISLDGLYPPRN